MAEDVPYRVSWSRQAIEVVKDYGEQLAEPEQTEFADLLRTIDDRLRRDPLLYGEIYRSRGGILDHLAVCSFVTVYFAIDPVRQFVLVRNCRFLSRRGE